MAQAETHLHIVSGRTASISKALDNFLDERMKDAWPVSVALTALAMRRRSPECDMTNAELAELVAMRAVERGYNVIFDADLLIAS